MPNITESKKKRIVFMGTPEFAVPSLSYLHKEGFNIVGVISAPSRPAGRGRQIQVPPVAAYALENGLTLLQPERLKSEYFIEAYTALKPDINIVVAFRMLPPVIWSSPVLGTFNLHASLLPLYRGAAPINWAIINGEKETGLSTFLIDEQIDTGNILFREKVPIEERETAGSLHDKLMELGPALIAKTIYALSDGTATPLSQQNFPEFTRQPLPIAPKLSKATGALNPDESAYALDRKIRGLSPYPGSYFEIKTAEGVQFPLRIGTITYEERPEQTVNYILQQTSNGELRFEGLGGSIVIESLQIPGKRMVSSAEFLRGWRGGEITCIAQTL